MATVVYSARSLEYIERAVTLLREENAEAARAALVAIQSAGENLAMHPVIGRRLERDLRELIISYGQTGYVALYRFVVQRDEARILALRHQREVGFAP